MKSLKTVNQVEIGKGPVLGSGPLLVQVSPHDWIPNCSLRCPKIVNLMLLRLWTPWTTIKGRIIDDSNPKTSIGGPHESRLSHAIDSCVAYLMEGYLDGQWTPQVIKHKKYRNLENLTVHSLPS